MLGIIWVEGYRRDGFTPPHFLVITTCLFIFLENYPLMLSLTFVKVVHLIFKVLTLSLWETVSIRG